MVLIALRKHSFNPVSFQRALEHLMRTLGVWCFMVSLILIGRIGWYLALRQYVPEGVSVNHWLLALWQGTRQDISIAGWFLLPTIVLGMFSMPFERLSPWVTRIRHSTAILYCLLTPFLVICSIGYYEAFNDCFDTFLFEFFNGNATDVIVEARREYHLIERLSVIALLTIVSMVIYRMLSKKLNFLDKWAQRLPHNTAWKQSFLTVVSIAFVAIAIRGGVGKRPVQKVDSSVTPFAVLNRGAVNPYLALRHAYKEHCEQQAHDRRELLEPEQFTKGLETWVRFRELNDSNNNSFATDLEDVDLQAPWLQHIAAGPKNKPPSHIFLLFLESYDSWPFQDQFKDLELVTCGKQLGKEGIFVSSFLPAANSSIVSYVACVQGLLETNRMRQESMPTSMVEQFRKLGYISRQINAFPADWCETRDISEEQGFDEVYCTEEILPGGEISNHQIHDRTSYRFTSELPYDKPSINIIRTSSNHGPWEVDLEGEHCVVDKLPEKVDGYDVARPDFKKLVYGHLKYSDRAMNDFVRSMSKRFPDALFVITGDHYGRNYPTNQPGIFARSSVPLILYGPEVLKDIELPANCAGSHLDIVPTLIELTAPKGYQYTSMGRNLFAPVNQPYGIGTNFVIFPDSIVCVTEPPTMEALPWATQKSFTDEERTGIIEAAMTLHQFFHGVGQWVSRESSDNSVAVASRGYATVDADDKR